VNLQKARWEYLVYALEGGEFALVYCSDDESDADMIRERIDGAKGE
jgi:GGDEF domain-containing protein